MKPMSRGERGKKVSRSTGGSLKRLYELRNPLKGDPRKMAYAEVSVKGAGIFVGFSLRF